MLEVGYASMFSSVSMFPFVIMKCFTSTELLWLLIFNKQLCYCYALPWYPWQEERHIT